MCMPSPKAPKPPAPPAEVRPKEASQLAPDIGGRTTDRDATAKKRLGRSGLRIDLQAGNTGAGGTGLNIPKV